MLIKYVPFVLSTDKNSFSKATLATAWPFSSLRRNTYRSTPCTLSWFTVFSSFAIAQRRRQHCIWTLL